MCCSLEEASNYTNINNPYRNNLLMNPLFKFNDWMGVTFSTPQKNGSDLLKKIGIAIIAPFAYLALSFTAAIGYCLDPLLRRKIKPSERNTLKKKLAYPPKPRNPKEESKKTLVPIPTREKPAKSLISLQELKSQVGKDSVFKGYDLMMKSTHLEDQLRDDYDANPKIMILTTIDDKGSIDRLLDANLEVDGFMAEFYRKGDPQYILIPILENNHYTGFFINHEKKEIFHYNPLGNTNTPVLWKRIDEYLTPFYPYKIYTNKTAHQKDGWTCGYRVQRFFEECLKKATMDEIDAMEMKTDEFHAAIDSYLNFLVEKQESIPEGFKAFVENLNAPSDPAIIFRIRNSIRHSCDANSRGDENDKKTVEALFAFLSKNPKLIKDLIGDKSDNWMTSSIRDNLSQLLMRIKDSKPQITNAFFETFRQIRGEPLSTK